MPGSARSPHALLARPAAIIGEPGRALPEHFRATMELELPAALVCSSQLER
jgi:hypothetical protein